VSEFKKLFAYGIFKVIYAPHKVFKEIAEKPKYIGPIIIMILFALTNVGFIYTVISKTYAEQTLPTAEQFDIWTENATFWTGTSGVNISENSLDFINGTYGTYYGNKSIEFSILNSKQLSTQLNFTDPINCSVTDGYRDLYLRIKWTNPAEKPENVTIHLFSVVPSKYFYYNLTEKFSNATRNVWNNLTIPLATQEWQNSSADVDWSIRGLGLEFTWLNNSNITLLADGLFFGGIFKSPVDNATSYMLNYSILSFMQFIIRWVFLGGLLFILTKAFKAKTVWRPVLIVVGFALITMFFEALVNIAAFSTVPTLYYRLAYFSGVNGETVGAFDDISAKTMLFSQISGYMHIAALLWTIALCAIAMKLLAEFSWSKSFLVATVAYFAATIVQSLILGF